MRVLMIFLDGVGIGASDPAVNPLFATDLPALRRIVGKNLFSLHHCDIRTPHTTLLPLNATLGVAGLPQSGTGQTALFTGENAARLIGKHFGPFPYSTLRPLIAKKNIFRLLKAHGLRPAFANAYPQRYFDYVALHPTRMTVAPYASLQSGVRLLEAADLAEGRGISADITGAGWHTLGYPAMRVIPHAEAGRRLAGLLEEHEFVLFEYWKTDHAGHAQNLQGACDVLRALDGMLSGVLEAMDLRRDLLIMTSDHGNLEDLRSKTHTRHPIPILLHGHRHQEMAAWLRECSSGAPTLCAVTPTLMRLFAADSG
jgi:2,3-bisphosphoglycerate-independent phosphoglycerate mutase